MRLIMFGLSGEEVLNACFTSGNLDNFKCRGLKAFSLGVFRLGTVTLPVADEVFCNPE